MNIQTIEQNFNKTELATIKKFLAWVNDTAKLNSDFADDDSLDQLNQFSGLAESDDDIQTNVREWLRLKKTRLRGNFTNN